MANWVLKGLRTGRKTTLYPAQCDATPGISPGRPWGTQLDSTAAASALSARCPTNAIHAQGMAISIEQENCIHCLRCKKGGPNQAAWHTDYEWAERKEVQEIREELETAFSRSLHIRFVDAGACGACMSEARQLNNPYYNMHRLGFFATPTPRNADILLVAGPLSDAMRGPLQKTYEAMPEPKRVVAMGVCAIAGGIFGSSFASAGGIAKALPVDVLIPGCPPPPLAILHGLLTVVRRKPPARPLFDLDTTKEPA